jgi:2-dehydro-3-deoxyphosphogluconate aldolase/(4S)-4-hydroxy-2-oxoglutarate aldolase
VVAPVSAAAGTAAALHAQLREAGVVPVVEIGDAGAAQALAAALAEGGLPVVEITLRTPAALDAIAAAAQVPGVLVGAGTLIEPETVAQAAAAGAAFGVSPGFDPDVVAAAARAALPMVPGAATATEVQACLRAGARLVKFFPAAASGGVAALRALAAPFRSHGVAFMPTGGIGEDTLGDYLSVPEVAAVGGSWLAPAADVDGGRGDAIAARARAARAIAAEVRAS